MFAQTYSRFELSLESEREYENPAQEVEVMFEGACGGERCRTRAFWDGGRTWRVRFCPERTGRWRWHTESTPIDSGLNGLSGEFEFIDGPGAFLGPSRVSSCGRHFVNQNGKPVFWLGDTVWNGPLKASAEDWNVFLTDRAAKGFNVIQFVATQWISATGDSEGRPAYLDGKRIRIEPAFFRRLDQRIQAINDAGMIAAPVLAWAANWNVESAHFNAGNSLSDEQLSVLLDYLVARYGAHQVVWILAGDGIYQGDEAERWRRLGRRALENTTRLATIHPGGMIWVYDEFANEPWFSFHGYQSGHWNNADNFRWITDGPLKRSAALPARHPHVNLEPCYEGHRGMATGETINAFDVRRACYWSLLAGPVAGVTYGAHGVWSWESSPNLPLSHPGTGIARPWFEAMHFPGSFSMSHLRALFESIEWWKLNPCPDLVAEQAGAITAGDLIAAGRSDDRRSALVYQPRGGPIQFRTSLMNPGAEVRCFNPADGEPLWQRPLESSMDSCAGGDRVLIIRTPE